MHLGRSVLWFYRKLANSCGAYVVIDIVLVLFEIIRKHRDKFSGLSVVGVRIVPSAARVEQNVGNAFDRNRNIKAKVRVFAVLSAFQ